MCLSSKIRCANALKKEIENVFVINLHVMCILNYLSTSVAEVILDVSVSWFNMDVKKPQVCKNFATSLESDKNKFIYNLYEN